MFSATSLLPGRRVGYGAQHVNHCATQEDWRDPRGAPRPYKARNSLLTLRVHPQVLLDVLLDGDPAIIDVDAWAENVDPLNLLQDETDERHSFARLAGLPVHAAWSKKRSVP